MAFFPMHNLGLGGMMRRIADPPIYEHLKQLQPLNQISTIGAIGLGFTTFIFIWNIIITLRIVKGIQGSGEPLACEYSGVDRAFASGTWQLPRDADRLPRALRVQRARPG